MNKKILIVLSLVILLVVGGLVASKQSNKKNNESTSNPNENTQNKEEVEQPSSLKDLIKNNVSQSCSYDQVGQNPTSGTVYTSAGKVKVDFSSVVDGKTTNSHMLLIDNTSYIWTDEQKTGYKTEVDPNKTTENTKDSFDLNAELNYNCKPWVANPSVFILPTDIEFVSLKDQLSSQCSVCNNLTGESKTQCLTALKCD